MFSLLTILGSLGLAAPVVFVPLDALRPPPEAPEAPPRAWLADRLEVELRPGEESRISLAWTLTPLEPGWVDIPLLGAGAAVASARVDGEPVSLAPGPDGMQHLVLSLDRRRRIEVEASLPTPAAALELPLAPASRRSVRVLGPWSASMAGAVPSRGRLEGGDPERLAIQWRPQGPPAPRPTLLRAESSAALRLDASGVEATARLRWRVSHGAVESVSFRLDPTAEALEVEGDGVLATERAGDRVTVRLARPVSDALELTVRHRAPPRGESGGELPIPWPEAAEVQGWATLLSGDESLLVPAPGPGVEPVPARALPAWSQGLAEGAPFASYHLSGERPSLGARVLRWEPIEGPPTVIDEARYELATVEHGRLALRARYQVRNDRRQFLRLDVPEELELVSVTVSGRAVQAARDSEGHLLVPLEKSVETLSGLVTFPVDIAFFGLEEAWARRGERVIRTPAVDAPIAYARWELVLPPGLGAGKVRANATEVPGWTSREVSLDYSRSYGEPIGEDTTQTLSTEFLAKIPTGRSYQTAVEVVAGVDDSGVDPDDDHARAADAENAETADFGLDGRRDALDLGRLIDRVPSRRPPPAAPPPPPAAQAPRSAPAEEVSQAYWNEAYEAYKGNRFEESRALLDEALRYDASNEAANALRGNLDVLLDTSGEAGGGEDELASRRVRELAKARTGEAELRQEALAREVEEAERAGDLAAAEEKLAELVEVSGVLASVEQAEQVEQKRVYKASQSRLDELKRKRAAPERAAPPSTSAKGSSVDNRVAPGSVANGPAATEEPLILFEEPWPLDEQALDDLPLEPGVAVVICEDPEAARQLQEALVVEPDLAALLSAEDVLGWTGEEGLHTEVVYASGAVGGGIGAYGSGSGGGGSASGHGQARVLALPQTIIIPKAGQILRFEARLLPEGQPLETVLTYHPARAHAR